MLPIEGHLRQKLWRHLIDVTRAVFMGIGLTALVQGVLLGIGFAIAGLPSPLVFGVLGALLGALGSTMSLPTRLMAVLVLAVAVVMFLLGVRLTGISPRVAGWTPRLPGGLGRLLGLDAAPEASYSHVRTALVGAGTFFLPCGFTQAVQLYALSTASAVTAGVVMATFAVGTTPGLLALASVPELASGQRQATVLRVVGVVVLAFALVNLSSSLNLLGVPAGRGWSSATATI